MSRPRAGSGTHVQLCPSGFLIFQAAVISTDHRPYVRVSPPYAQPATALPMCALSSAMTTQLPSPATLGLPLSSGGFTVRNVIVPWQFFCNIVYIYARNPCKGYICTQINVCNVICAVYIKLLTQILQFPLPAISASFLALSCFLTVFLLSPPAALLTLTL